MDCDAAGREMLCAAAMARATQEGGSGLGAGAVISRHDFSLTVTVGRDLSVGRSLHEPPSYGAYGHQRPHTLAYAQKRKRGQRAHTVEITEHIEIIASNSSRERESHESREREKTDRRCTVHGRCGIDFSVSGRPGRWKSWVGGGKAKTENKKQGGPSPQNLSP